MFSLLARGEKRGNRNELAHHLGWSEHSVMAAGGWADYKTVHNIYTKLAEKDAAKDAKKMTRFYKKITNENTNASKKH